MQHAPDNDIIDLVLKGQQKHFTILVERYQHYVYTLTLRYIKNTAEAEEIAQDTFVKAYKSLSAFNRNSKFSTWLYTITKNTCLSHLRKNQQTTSPIIDTNIADPSRVTIQYKSEKEQLNKAISMLQQEEQVIIILYYLHEQNIKEISKILSLTDSNVKVKLYRARKSLKTIIEKHFKEELTR